MKCKLILLLVAFVSAQVHGQTLTVKKTCECTLNANISSSVRHSSSSFYPGKTYKTYVKVTNDGSCIWSKYEIELRVKIVRCPSGSACQRDELIPKKWDKNEDFVDPRGTEEYIYDWEGPAYTGKFVLQLQAYYEGKPFGDPINTTIEMLPAKN